MRSAGRYCSDHKKRRRGRTRCRWFRRLSAASIGQALLAAEPQVASPHDARVHDILEFGAKGDGQTLNTRALRDAIDACHKDQGGVSNRSNLTCSPYFAGSN